MAKRTGPSEDPGTAGPPLEQLSKEELAELIARYQEQLSDPTQQAEGRQRLETELQRTRTELFGRWLRERTGSG